MRFVDLHAQHRQIATALNDRLQRVFEHGQYIMGPEVGELEQELATFTGASEVVTCSNGTDALVLILMAWGVGEGDAVFVPTFTFTATAEAVVLVGATPVFVDVSPDTFNMDPQSLQGAVRGTKDLKAAAVIPVDLFGLPADYAAIEEVASAGGLHVLADAAQSFGATSGGRHVGALAEATATSFFPAKPLGCYGDGGAIFTDDPRLAEILRSLRVHGQGSHKYENLRVGTNARLDTIQAVVLIEKLKIFPEELQARARIASVYEKELSGKLITPLVPPGLTSAWAQYTVRVNNRDEIARRLDEAGIPTAVYYEKPLHLQPAYASYPRAAAALPNAEHLSTEVLSIPVHPYLDDEEIRRVVESLDAAI